MIIRSLKLQNYRKYKEAFIEFPDGLFGIVGNNGAGKTTIIEAITWCIYGAVASKTGQELIKREQADSNSDCRVELEFLLGSDSYRAIRELRGVRQSAYAAVYVNNSSHPEVEGIHPVTRFLSNRIGMDYISFSTSIFAKQKELDALSDLKPAERKKIVLRLLRIDRIDVAINKMKQDKKESDARIEAIRGTLLNIDKLNSTLDELKKQKVSDADALNSEGAAVKEAKRVLEEIKKVKDTLEVKHSRYQNLMNQMKVQNASKTLNAKNLNSREEELKGLEDAKGELSEIKPKLKPFPSIKRNKEKLDGLREKYLARQGLRKQLSEIEERISGLKDERKDIVLKIRKAKKLDSQLKKVEKAMGKYQKQSSDLDKQIAGKKASIQEYKKQRVELSSQSEEIKKLGPNSKCPICNKIIGKDFPDIVEHFRKEIAKIGNKIKARLGLIDKLSKQHDKVNKLFESTKSEKERIGNLLKQRARDEQKKEGLERQIQSEIQRQQNISNEISKIGVVKYNEVTHSEVKRLFDELSQVEKRRIALAEQVSRTPSVKKSIRTLKSSLVTIAKKMSKITNSIAALRFKEEEYEKAKRDYTAADRHFHNKRENLIKAKGKLASATKEIANTIKQIAEEKRKRKQIEKEQRKIEILNSLEKIFGDFRIELISRIRPLLSLRSSELFRKLTDSKYPNITFDEDYDILIEDSGNQFPLERFSGGEEDLASLCLRIAVSQVIEERSGASGINFIALDEIFGSQDEARRNNILKALSELTSQFRQIIVITHVEDIRDTLPYVFIVIEMADNSSKIITEGSPRMALSA